MEDRRREVGDHEDDRDHQEDNHSEPDESGVEGPICGRIVPPLEVDGEEPGDRGVERLDDDRHIPGDRGRERDDPVGCNPEGIDEVGDQEDADDDIHQEVGDVCREVAGELGGEPAICLIRAGYQFRRHVFTVYWMTLGSYLRGIKRILGVLPLLEVVTTVHSTRAENTG